MHRELRLKMLNLLRRRLRDTGKCFEIDDKLGKKYLISE